MWRSPPPCHRHLPYAVSPKCCYFHRGNTTSGFKMTSHSLSRKKEVGSLGPSPGWTLCTCPNLRTPQCSSTWDSQVPLKHEEDPCFQCFQRTVVPSWPPDGCAKGRLWAGAAEGEVGSPGSTSFKCQKCSHGLHW